MPRTVDRPLVYYACGGGLGHVTRAAAILRQARRLGQHSLLALTNAVLPLPLHHEQIPFIHCPAETRPELAAQLREAFSVQPPGLLVVDAFPAGVLGELPELLPALPCHKVLVLRCLREPYHAQVTELLPLFDRVLLAEDCPLPAGIPAVPCGPMLIRDAEERLPRAEARRRLGVHDDTPVVLGVSTGSPEWSVDFFALLQKALHRLRRPAHLRFAAPRHPDHPLLVTHYPLCELFNGVDIVIGASGYNLFHEVTTSGIRGIFLPQSRRYDDQEWRARHARVARSPEELEAALQHALEQPRPEAPSIPNGATLAARMLVEMISP